MADLVWHKVMAKDELAEGRVMPVTCAHMTLCMTHHQGQISKEQKAGNWDVWQTSLTNPSFAEYANLCGALGIRVEKKAELDGALQQALEYDGPSLVEVISDVELI